MRALCASEDDREFYQIKAAGRITILPLEHFEQ
jgi:hypothetical protein